MSGFDTVVVVDWSARSSPSPVAESADAIWIGIARDSHSDPEVQYHRTRDAAVAALSALFEDEIAAGRKVLAGFDFPFAYPRGFGQRVCGSDDPLALWQALSARIEDAEDNANNRWAVAGDLNDLFPGLGPFWGCPATHDDPRLPAKGTARHGHGLPERRNPEARLSNTQPVWKLYTTGSVGSQALLGIPRLQALRDRFGAALSVRPFEAKDTPITLVELFPSLIAGTVADLSQPDEIKDRAQVRILAQALRRLPGDQLDAMTREGDTTEGWILGLGHEATLVMAAKGQSGPRPLANDCFAMPPGVSWVPVDEAQARLRAALHCVVGTEVTDISAAAGRILSAPVQAARSNPPSANSAVDGYGFAAETVTSGAIPLAKGRAAAGQPFDGAVPVGHALRILTGAILPEGVDTVVLEEDCQITPEAIRFDGKIKPGANTRRAGEDVEAGAEALPQGTRLRAPELALLSALGVAEVPVYRRLRVGVLSTGDEILPHPSHPALPHQIWDANRPMLGTLAAGWGYEAVDLGHAPDDTDAIRARLDEAVGQVDVVLTSGGASAGDEDHVSRLLRDEGQLTSWRIALKPGRPLALALWQGVPVFGLPGNPVAALVCALIFARPALSLMAGAGWQKTQGFEVPAAFEKRKKPGRREYLRARLTEDGRAEVFASEGSGRISGLAWAEGLVELPDGAVEVTPGTPVRYLPFGLMGLS